MAQSESDFRQQLVRNVDDALAQNPALTPEQFEDVRQLRGELQELCRSGRLDKAKRCEEMALAIIREDAPVSE
jgi:hypothetical protein